MTPTSEMSPIRAKFMEKVGEGRIKFESDRQRFVLLGRDSMQMGKSLKDRLVPATPHNLK